MTSAAPSKRQKVVLPKGMESAPTPNQMIKLNVGGRSFITTRGTLTQVPNSFLALNFSGRWDGGLTVDEEGCVFLDSEPDDFKTVLQLLRRYGINPEEANKIWADELRMNRSLACTWSYLGPPGEVDEMLSVKEPFPPPFHFTVFSSDTQVSHGGRRLKVLRPERSPYWAHLCSVENYFPLVTGAPMTAGDVYFWKLELEEIGKQDDAIDVCEFGISTDQPHQSTERPHLSVGWMCNGDEFNDKAWNLEDNDYCNRRPFQAGDSLLFKLDLCGPDAGVLHWWDSRTGHLRSRGNVDLTKQYWVYMALVYPCVVWAREVTEEDEGVFEGI